MYLVVVVILYVNSMIKEILMFIIRIKIFIIAIINLALEGLVFIHFILMNVILILLILDVFTI